MSINLIAKVPLTISQHFLLVACLMPSHYRDQCNLDLWDHMALLGHNEFKFLVTVWGWGCVSNLKEQGIYNTSSAPWHHLNQCSNIVNWTLRNKLQWNLNRNSNIFIHENTFENVVWKMAAILSLPQCVKTCQWQIWEIYPNMTSLKTTHTSLFDIKQQAITWNYVVPSSMISGYVELTHWGRVTHICVSDLAIIGSDNGLSPGGRQAIIWTNAGILLIGPLGTNCSEILIEILTFSFKKIRLKMSSAKWRPFCLSLNVLITFFHCIVDMYISMASWI